MANHENNNQFGTYQLPPFFAGLRDRSVEKAKHDPRPNVYSRVISRYSKMFNRPYDVDWDGIKMRLFPKENAGDRWIFRYGVHSEHEDLHHLKELYEGKQLSVVDIGANVGIYTLFLSKILDPKSKIVCFEPHPTTYKRLMENIQFNNPQNVVPLNAGVGEKDETAWLYGVKSSNLGSNSLLPKNGNKQGNKTKIELRALEGVLKQENFSSVDILKIDIEGYEDRALLPFIESCDPSLLPKHILIEDNRHQWERDCFDVLVQRGYEITRTKGQNGNTHLMLR